MTTAAYVAEAMSNNTHGAILSQPAIDSSKSEDFVESRFGTIKVNRANAIYFPRGILGFPENLDFCLSDFPADKMKQFKVLQCLNDHELSFAVLPMAAENDLIQMSDIMEAAEILGIEKQDLAIMLIVSVHRLTTSVSLSVNLRAPILVDTSRKLAAQFVFANSNYEIRHFIQQ